MGNNLSKTSPSSGSSSCSNTNSGLPSSTLATSDEESSKPPPSRCPQSDHSEDLFKSSSLADYKSPSGTSSTLNAHSPGPLKTSSKKVMDKPSDASYFHLLAHSFEDDRSDVDKAILSVSDLSSGTTIGASKAIDIDQLGSSSPRSSSTAIQPRHAKHQPTSFHTTTDISSVSSDFSSNSMLSTTPNSTHLDSSEDMARKAPISSNKCSSSKIVTAATARQQPAPSTNIQKLYNPKFNKKVINHYEIDIDSIIERLIEIGLSKSYSNNSLVIEKNEINYIITKSKEIFLSQPTLLELSSPIKVVGDLHGQFNDLLRIMKLSGFPPMSNYLFLGDYVDRGKQSLETILLLLCFKIKYPNNFFMLRGNHESGNISKIYGFYDECKRRLGSVKLWKNFVDVFNVLPIAAIISDKIFCVHGGLSPFLKSLKQINKIKRPTDIPEVGLLSDLLWSDPNAKINEWCPNDRGISFFFSKKNVNEFLSKFKFDLIVRGHMVVEDGYEFFNKKKLVTVFSAPNYCGEFNNWGAVMNIDKNLLCSFELLKPVDLKKKNKKENSR